MTLRPTAKMIQNDSILGPFWVQYIMVTYYYAIENCCYQNFSTKNFSKNEKNAKISGKNGKPES